MSTHQSIVTLTTDFGNRDGYVAAMKGVILSLVPDVQLVDITHEVSPQDVMEAAHVLSGAASCFPPGTIHLVVVDPEVGSGRKGIGLEARGQIFVGPDNGLFSLFLGRETADRIVELDNSEFWRTPDPSATFHGRDIFAPAAAHVAAGVALERLGTEIDELQAMHWALPISDDQGIQGWVVHVDAFGNCITNIDRTEFEKLQTDRAFKCYVGNSILYRRHGTYAEAAVGDPLLLFNSDDCLEVAINRGNASDLLDIRKGAQVNIVFTEERQVDG